MPTKLKIKELNVNEKTFRVYSHVLCLIWNMQIQEMFY